MADQHFDPDLYTKMGNLTSRYHRDIYHAVAPTNPKNSAAGKIVLVTGASQSVGQGLAPSWAEAGAAGIVVTSRRVEDLQPVTEEIKKRSGGKTEVLAIACELTRSGEVAELFAKIKERFGKLDVVVANAGIYGAESLFPKLGEWEPELWWKDMECNVQTMYHTAHYYIKTFGPDPSGTFIGMTSAAAGIVLPGMSSYSTSKQACIRLVEFLDVEYPSIRAFAMTPGIVKDHTTPAFAPFAHDTLDLVGGFTVWLASGRADKLKGGFVSLNWDVEELEKYGDEIAEKQLLKTKFLGEILGPEGYNFGQ